MTKRVIVCLGNGNPKRYLQDVPQPPDGAGIKQVREFVAGRIGQAAVDRLKGHDQERECLIDLNNQVRDLDPRPWEGGNTCTTIEFSPASTPSEMLSEARTIWRAHAHEKPRWIAGTDATIVEMLASELGVDEIREYKEAGE